MRSTPFLAAAMAVLAVPLAAAPVLVADTNRDGEVDFDADLAGKDKWTSSLGAVFLNNNDSDQDTGRPDYADAIVNGDEDLEDLAPLRLRQIEALTGTELVTLTVDEQSQGRVRIFLYDGRYFPTVDLYSQGNIPAEALKDQDLEFYLEASQYADARWSGQTTVTVDVEGVGSDSVELKVAPWIMTPHTLEGEVVYVREFPGRNEAFLEALREIVPAAGAELVVIPGGEPYSPHNIWLQDTLEIGYQQLPGAEPFSVVMKANRNKPLDNFAKDQLLGPDYGWHQQGEFRPEYGSGAGATGYEWLDWYGNLEVTPPLPGFPMGRIIYGGDGFEDPVKKLNPQITAMLEAQGVQGPPVRFDVGWLLIKHIDEMISFLPTGNPVDPYRVLVPDTTVALDLLAELEAGGKGNLPLLEIYRDAASVSSLLGDADLVALNRKVQKERIEPNIDKLKAEFGLEEKHLIRVPYLKTAAKEAIIPNMVNSLVLNGHVVAPDPHGPEVDGVDQFARYFRDAVEGSTDLQVHYVDDRQYHKWSGNVHCGTNAKRKPFELAWWEAGP